jgi:hypothetical protein
MTHGLNKYVSHKIVTAGKIVTIAEQIGAQAAELMFEDDRPMGDRNPQVLVRVDGAYVAKHNPQVGGYYVRYEDGYESWSPAEAFEAGYTLEVQDNFSPAEAE